MVIYAPLSLVLSRALGFVYSQELKQSQGSQGTQSATAILGGEKTLGGWVRGYEGHKLLLIVLCCLSLLRFIEMAKKNKQCARPLRWEPGAKVTKYCLILFS